MGNWYQKFDDHDATVEKAVAVAEQITAWLVAEQIVEPELTDCVLGGLGHRPGLRADKAFRDPEAVKQGWTGPNGLELDAGRRLVYYNHGETEGPWCAQCQHLLDLDRYFEALDTWYEHGETSLICPDCRWLAHINDWRTEPQWGVGHLQLHFWNWPELSEEFKTGLINQFDGHRVLYHWGKT